jgi:TRAP-type uncharacterized transport system substrate-binding protein
MANLSSPISAVSPTKQVSRHVFAVLALLSLAAAVGLWYWFNQTVEESLKLDPGMELRFREGLTTILCDEAQARHLKIEMPPNHQKVGDVELVSKHELDAAIIPAGLSQPAENVRQVTMMDCQLLHLFVKPEMVPQGLAGLRGRTVLLGPAGSGVRCVAEEVLKFGGLTAGKDFVEDPRGYEAIMKSPPNEMPDAIFGLSPLPSPLGEKLARLHGYQLMELPMGEALAVGKPAYEDAAIPADMYGAAPAVPQTQLHTIGVRSVLIAHQAVSSVAIERLLEVLYESDYSRRANLKKMDPALLQRSSDYPFHRGTAAYLHRGDPFHVKELLAKLQGLIGSTVSVLSAILLAWQWIRRKKVEVGEYQQICATLDLDAQRAACQGQFGEIELGACLTELAKLKTQVLEQHHQQFMSGDKAVVDVVTRIEGLQKLLPSLVRTKVPPKRMQLDFGPPQRKAA